MVLFCLITFDINTRLAYTFIATIFVHVDIYTSIIFLIQIVLKLFALRRGVDLLKKSLGQDLFVTLTMKT